MSKIKFFSALSDAEEWNWHHWLELRGMHRTFYVTLWLEKILMCGFDAEILSAYTRAPLRITKRYLKLYRQYGVFLDSPDWPKWFRPKGRPTYRYLKFRDSDTWEIDWHRHQQTEQCRPDYITPRFLREERSIHNDMNRAEIRKICKKLKKVFSGQA